MYHVVECVMPLPQYIPFRQKLKASSLREVTGWLRPGEVLFEVERGARFVVYDYVVSALIVCYLRRSPVIFIRAGESGLRRGLPYALVSLFLGWWEFPSGVMRTPRAIYSSLRGGRDVTQSVMERTRTFLENDHKPTTAS